MSEGLREQVKDEDLSHLTGRGRHPPFDRRQAPAVPLPWLFTALGSWLQTARHRLAAPNSSIHLETLISFEELTGRTEAAA